MISKYVAAHFHDNTLVDVFFSADFDGLIFDFIESLQSSFVSFLGHKLVLIGYFDSDYVFHNLHPETLMVSACKSISKELISYEE